MEKIKVLALGGLDEEGKDLYCIEINGDIFVINCGFKHPTRFTPGIDFIISDFTYLKENKKVIKSGRYTVGNKWWFYNGKFYYNNDVIGSFSYNK